MERLPERVESIIPFQAKLVSRWSGICRLLLKLNESESKNLFELIHKRRKKSSTIFCSQFREEGWYDRLGGNDNPLADAIMDRIIYDAYKINIESIDPSKDISMREIYGIDQNIVQ